MIIMTNLFSNVTSGRGSNKTAELTTLAEKITAEVFNKIGNKIDVLEKSIATFKAEYDAIADKDSEAAIAKEFEMQSAKQDLDSIFEAVEDSKVAHDAMDKLITDNYSLQSVDVDFLKFEGKAPEKPADETDEKAMAEYNALVAKYLKDSEEHDATIDKMIKSQQSKRSRAKSKAMTQDNYNTLMTGAIAENLLRISSGKEKQGVGFSSGTKAVSYDDATLESYKTDKEKLNKEIRNIQSKKSIMKSKANFDEKSEAYQNLLEAEALLKGLRGDSSAPIVKVVVPAYTEQLVEVKKLVDEEIATQDLSKIKLQDAKEMLTLIVTMMAGISVDEQEEETKQFNAEEQTEEDKDNE